MRKKYHVYLTFDELKITMNSLISEKNRLLITGHYTDAVDEVIEKVMKATVKNVRVKEV